MNCGKMVESGFIGFPCEIPVKADGTHDGPCMSKDAPRSVAARNQWAESQQAIGAFQVERRAVDTMVDEGSITRLRGMGRKFRPHMVGAVEIRMGRWAVSNGWDDEWFPLIERSKLSGIDISKLPSLPCYVKVGGEICLLVDDTLNESIQAQAQMFICGKRTDTPAEAAQIAVEEASSVASPPVISGERVADEPPPVEGEGDMWEEVIADMVERRSVGIERYGTPLQRWNGRNAANDAYQEVLDLAVYLRQFVTERQILAQLAALVRNGYDAPVDSVAKEAGRASLDKLCSLLGQLTEVES